MNSTSKIAIIGAHGMLGYAVSSYFRDRGYPVVEITRKEFDIARNGIEKLEPLIDSSDVVINCAGVIKPRIDQTSFEDVLKVNSIFPRNLARLCNNHRKKCIHITTDCAFSGRRGQYHESDYFDAGDVYGMSKNAGEFPDCMILRTSIIGEEKGEGRSLLSWVLGQRGKEVNGFSNHFWNGVTTTYLAEIMETIIEQGLFEPGLFHVFSKETVSKYDLLKLINEAYDLGIRVNKHVAAEPSDRSLSTLGELNGKVVKKTLTEQIQEMRKFFSME